MLYLSILFSWVVVAFGSPVYLPFLCKIAAFFGYGALWLAIADLKAKKRFFIGSIWFCAVQLIQLFWLATTTYNGPLMIGLYITISAILGLLFGLICLIVKKPFTLSLAFSIASLATLLEWLRWQPLCGFSWNPAGLALAWMPKSAQLASICGVLGLSFWVFFTNGVGLWALGKNHRGLKKNFKPLFLWFLVAAFPYIFGALYIRGEEIKAYRRSKENASAGNYEPNDFKVLAVQPMIAPPVDAQHPEGFYPIKSALDNWARVFSIIKPHKDEVFNMIAFPEACFVFEGSRLLIPKTAFGELFQQTFDKPILLPERGIITQTEALKAVANALDVEIISGHIDSLEEGDLVSSAAIYVKPSGSVDLYAKRRLFPVAEHMPYAWCRKIGADFGIFDAFKPGKKAVVFDGSAKISPMICYEETFPSHARAGRNLSANLLMGLSNDAWYPRSRLANSHKVHAQLRAIESGVPLVRICNTGISALIDRFGFEINEIAENEAAAKVFTTSLQGHSTFYMKFGDKSILWICSLGIGALALRELREKRRRFALA